MINKYKYSNDVVPRDAYFTPKDTAHKIVEYLLELYPDWKGMEWFEPSAGAGVFLDAAHEHGVNASGVDIHPMRADVEQADFLETDIDLSGKIVFGNPPFGYRQSLSIRFIHRAFELGAEYVAFLLGGGILGSQNLMRVPFIERIKAVENRFENGENKHIKISPNTALFVFSRKEQDVDWKYLYSNPYIENVKLGDAVDGDFVMSNAYRGTYGDLIEITTVQLWLDGAGRYHEVDNEFFIDGRKSVGRIYRVQEGFDLDFIEKLSPLSSICFRLSPRTMNYWLSPENRVRIDFDVL